MKVKMERSKIKPKSNDPICFVILSDKQQKFLINIPISLLNKGFKGLH